LRSECAVAVELMFFFSRLVELMFDHILQSTKQKSWNRERREGLVVLVSLLLTAEDALACPVRML
jgi:hypothetical protein